MVDTIFSPNTEGGVASYSFNDISSGSATLIMYGAIGGSTQAYYLSPIKGYSDTLFSSAGINGDPIKGLDLDFDYLVNKQMVIKGTFAVFVPLRGYGRDGDHVWAVCKLRKWDGATETELSGAGGQSKNYPKPAGVDGYFATGGAICLLTVPQAIIKKGEYLRLTVEGWGHGIGLSAVEIGHDPMGRTTIGGQTWSDISTLKIDIQAKIFT